MEPEGLTDQSVGGKVNAAKCVIVYRGPLERSRLSFILHALSDYIERDFVWIYPGVYNERAQKIYSEFIPEFGLTRQHILNDRLGDFFTTRRKLTQLFANHGEYDLAMIGDSASIFQGSLQPKHTTWFINGVPEENAMRKPVTGKLRSWLQWTLYRASIRPDLIVTVSERMSRYVRKRFANVPIFAAPTCVDVDTFRYQGAAAAKRSGVFGYLGTGAPWQALDLLSGLWQAIHRKDPTIKFRVISRDPRARILATGIAPDVIEFVQSNSFSEVAKFLYGVEAGFLIRRPDVVNEVSFPTKLAEYLATGCWVAASDLDWDVSDYIRKFDVGVLCSTSQSIDEQAARILRYREEIRADALQEKVRKCVDELDRDYWIKKLHTAISQSSGNH